MAEAQESVIARLNAWNHSVVDDDARRNRAAQRRAATEAEELETGIRPAPQPPAFIETFRQVIVNDAGQRQVVAVHQADGALGKSHSINGT